MSRIAGARPARVVLFAILVAFVVAAPASAVSDVVISQVYGGAGCGTVGCSTYKNDFIELFNRGTAGVSLNGWSVQYAAAGGSTWQVTPLGSVTLLPGQYYLVAEAFGTNGVNSIPTPDVAGSIAMSATSGKVALVSSTAALSGACPAASSYLDFIGFGTASCSEGTPAPALTTTTAHLRAMGGCTDTDANSSDFSALTPAPRNTATAFAPCTAPDSAPSVASSVPANGSAFDSASAWSVTFSEPVVLNGGGVSVVCASTGSHSVVVGSGPTAWTLTVGGAFQHGESCTLTIGAAAAADVDPNDPPDTMAADFVSTFTIADLCLVPHTSIPVIQGSGSSSAFDGTTLTTRGVVVGGYQGAGSFSTGFFLQDATGDGDPATSDGVFVVSSSPVSLGDGVSVTGTVDEYFGQTILTGVTALRICSTGSVVAPVDVTLPFPSAADPERFEGMLVRFPQSLTVTDNFTLARYGEFTVSSAGRLPQPTEVADPGAPANAVAAANALDRIVVDDGIAAQNPDPEIFSRSGAGLSASDTLRSGDTTAGVVGNVGYGLNAYRLYPTGAMGGGLPSFVAANPRPPVPPVAGRLRIAAFSLLNYFNTFGFNNCSLGTTGGPGDCRGATSSTEFERQADKTVATLLGSGADLLVLEEMENDGYGPTSAIRDLVDRLNAVAGAGIWAFLDVDARTGIPDAAGSSDVTKVAMIYKAAEVSPVGTTAALATASFLSGGEAGPVHRPAIAQAFQEIATGEWFVAVGVHLKSKGAACANSPDTGDGQGNCNGARLNSVIELAAWLGTDPTGTADPDRIVLGDWNAWSREDPIDAMAAAGYENAVGTFAGANGYSYGISGQWGRLDHAMVSEALLPQAVSAGAWHTNADEPIALDYNLEFKSVGQQTSFYAPDEFRASDHDLVFTDLDLVTIDAAAIGIGAPSGSLAAGTPFTPSATFRNDGTSVLTGLPVRLRITGPSPSPAVVYEQTSTVASLAPAASGIATFPSGSIAAAGTYTVTATAEHDDDFRTANDQATTSVSVDVVGTVPSGAGPFAPLLVRRNPAAPQNVDLTWGASCGPEATDFAVYQGALGTFYGHSSAACSTAGAYSISNLAPPPGDRYFLVAPLASSVEGSYGTKSDGAEIPAAAVPCRATRSTVACGP